MAALALALVVVGLALLWLARRVRTGLGLPAGQILSRDMDDGRRAGEALYDPVLDLSGRPDYLVESAGRLIPVEVKSGRSFAGPRAAHRLQLAAYCRLVEAVHARRPPYGRLEYADRGYRLPYTRAVETELKATLAEMRERAEVEQDRSHRAAERCRACGHRSICDQALA